MFFGLEIVIPKPFLILQVSSVVGCFRFWDWSVIEFFGPNFINFVKSRRNYKVIELSGDFIGAAEFGYIKMPGIVIRLPVMINKVIKSQDRCVCCGDFSFLIIAVHWHPPCNYYCMES